MDARPNGARSHVAKSNESQGADLSPRGQRGSIQSASHPSAASASRTAAWASGRLAPKLAWTRSAKTACPTCRLARAPPGAPEFTRTGSKSNAAIASPARRVLCHGSPSKPDANGRAPRGHRAGEPHRSQSILRMVVTVIKVPMPTTA
jgi:hypothetical protein